MGTTTALFRQAVINGAVIKPAKHEADGFRWLEGWLSRCFAKTIPSPLSTPPLPFEPPSGCIFPLYQAVPPTATLRPVNIFYFPFWHIRLPFTFAVGRTSEMFANKRRERYTQGSIVPRIFVPFFSFIYFFIFFFPEGQSSSRGYLLFTSVHWCWHNDAFNCNRVKFNWGTRARKFKKG